LQVEHVAGFGENFEPKMEEVKKAGENCRMCTMAIPNVIKYTLGL
jgi:hypothetical protein